MRFWLLKSRNLGFLIVACMLLATSSGSQNNSLQKSKAWQNKQHRLLTSGQRLVRSELQSINTNALRALSGRKLQKSATRVESPLRPVLKNWEPRSLNLAASREQAQRRSGLAIHWHEKNRTPVFITGEGLTRQSERLQLSKIGSPAQAVMTYLRENLDLFKLDEPAQELRVVSEKTDGLAMHHIKFQQLYKGVPIWGHNLVAHFDAGGALYAINARYSPTPRDIDVNASRISSQDAISLAETDLTGETEIQPLTDRAKIILNYVKPSAQKYIWVDRQTGTAHLVWHVAIRPNLRDYFYYFIDAGSGAILESYNATNFDGPTSASATDVNGVSRTIKVFEVGNAFFMIDASRDIFN
ncbi:MAG TPA: hypothetical protein VGA99_00915, partial [bacterium]